MGYYDASDWQAASKADVYIDAWVDMLGKVNGISLGMVSGSLTKEEAEAKIDGAIEATHVPVLKLMEAQLAEAGPFLGGEKVGIADCCLVATLAN